MAFYLVLAAVFLLDQASKILAVCFLSETATVPVIPPVFHLTLVHNTGIAFGFFREHPAVLLTLISLSLVFLFVWGSRIPPKSAFERISVAMILGGALGNWLDRVRLGAVVDFFDFRIWPVFNVADSAITIGVSLLAWHLMRKKTL